MGEDRCKVGPGYSDSFTYPVPLPGMSRLVITVGMVVWSERAVLDVLPATTPKKNGRGTV